jgi:hypothetical protein
VDTYGITGLVRRGGSRDGGDVPGQELCDAINRVVGDARQQLAQVGFGIKPVELRRSDQTVEGGCAFSAAVRSSKQPRLLLDARAQTTEINDAPLRKSAFHFSCTSPKQQPGRPDICKRCVQRRRFSA